MPVISLKREWIGVAVFFFFFGVVFAKFKPRGSLSDIKIIGLKVES